MSTEEGRGWETSRAQGQTRKGQLCGNHFFFLRQGLACLSLLSDGITGTGHHAWFTHMILNRLKNKKPKPHWRLVGVCCEGAWPAPSVLTIDTIAARPLDPASTGLLLCWGVSRRQTVGGRGCQPWEGPSVPSPGGSFPLQHSCHPAHASLKT